MNITIRPTPAKTMKPGDLFRDRGHTFQIADIEQDADNVEIVYYTGGSPRPQEGGHQSPGR